MGVEAFEGAHMSVAWYKGRVFQSYRLDQYNIMSSQIIWGGGGMSPPTPGSYAYDCLIWDVMSIDQSY